MDLKNKNRFSTAITIIVGICIIIFFAIFLNADSIGSEDFFQIFYNYKNFWEFYSTADHGCFISWIYIKLIGYYIPTLLGMHPSSSLFSNIMVAFDFAIYIFLISNFASIFTKRKTLMPVWYILAFAIMYHLFFCMLYGCVTTYCRHFRYVFTAVFYFLFWGYFIKIFVEQQITKRQTFYISTISFLVGLSTECVNLSTFFSIIIFIFCQLIIIINKEKGSILNALKHIKNIDRIFYISAFWLILGIVCFYINPGFWLLAKQRQAVSNIDNLSVVWNLIHDFMQSLFKILFVLDYQIGLSIALIVLSLIILILYKNNEKSRRIVLSAWILVIGVCAFDFTLIIPGKTFFDGYSFWIVAPELRAFVFAVFLSANFLLIGHLIENIISSKKRETIISIILWAISITSLIFVCNHYMLDYKNSVENTLKLKKLTYKIEKMYVFYGEKNETAILPKSLSLEKNVGHIILSLGIFKGYPSWFLTPYYTTIYDKKSYVPIKLLPDEEAMKEFNSRGGVFEPGEIEKCDFNKLLDKDFVLNTKK